MQTTTKADDTPVRQPGLRPVRMTLFPTLDSLDSVIDLGISQLPINNANQLVSLLMTYHNSLLKQIDESNKHEEAA